MSEQSLIEVARFRLPIEVRFLSDITAVITRHLGKGCRMMQEGDWLVILKPEKP